MNTYPHLLETDPVLGRLLSDEEKRQRGGLELIASENYVSPSVLEAQGSLLTNKYAEGYPGARYYGGCEVVDQVESLALERVIELFGGSKLVTGANVQAHSGSQANMASYFGLVRPGDTIMGMNLAHGGHLTHGSPVSFSGKLFRVVSYNVHPETHLIDMDHVRDLALKERPKLIIAGASSYSRFIDFKGFREIADQVGAFFLVDMAHIAGLVATGLHPSPLEHADVVTSTTHKTLRGPRGGLILYTQRTTEAQKKAIQSQIFPGIQGGPLMHVIAAKAVCFSEALGSEFHRYTQNVVNNTKSLAQALKDRGYQIISGGTDNHLFSIDVKKSRNLTGAEAEKMLGEAHVTVNKNMIPYDTLPPKISSGLRLGLAALTTRGFGHTEILQVAQLIDECLLNQRSKADLAQDVSRLALKFPLYKKTT